MRTNGATTITAYEFVIMRMGEEPIFFRPKFARLLLGRDSNSDIPLNSPAISRQHAKLHFEDGCWHVIDLGSANKTYLGSNAVAPNVATIWRSAEPLRIGPFTIQKQEAHADGHNPTLFLQPLAPVETALTMTTSNQIEAEVETSEIHVVPGQSTSTAISIFNPSDSSLRLRANIKGLPANWFDLSSSQLVLQPSTRRQLILHISLPEDVKAGIHPFSIDFTNEGSNEISASVSATLDTTNESFYAFSADLRARPNRITLKLHNKGNVDDTYKLSSIAPAGIKLVGHQWTSILKPTQFDDIHFRPQVTRPIVGTTQQKPVAMTIMSSSGISRTEEATVFVKPYVPLWTVLVLAVLIAIALVITLSLG